MGNQIVILGDIHGSYKVIQNFFRDKQLENITIFQVGDFGVGFNDEPRDLVKEQKTLKLLSDYLVKRKSHLYVVRGNHDDPGFFDGTHDFVGITFMVDYKIYTVNDITFLPIGGAISLDKIDRKEGKSWWPKERVVYNQALDDIKGVDVVLTHTTPNFAPPFGSNTLVDTYCERTMGLREELLYERNLMARIADKILERSYPAYWFYGHYHNSFISEYENTKMVGLDINEFMELKTL